MKHYQDKNRNSGVVAYEYGENWIKVQFKSGSIYEYTYVSAGQQNVEYMKKLAESGDGLNAFINTHVKDKYKR